MINKEEMLALVRSVAVPDDVEQGMGHAFDLGVDWERSRVEKILSAWWETDGGKPNMEKIVQDVLNGTHYS